MSAYYKALETLSENISKYALVSGLTISEILDKKGNDLRIQLFKGFWNQKFGGKGAKKKDIAFRELARRTKGGLGTLVRLKFLDTQWGEAPSVGKTGRPLSLWQKLVWQETMRRESGIGILGVSFLSKRFRFRKTTDALSGLRTVERYSVANVSKTLGELVRISKDAESFTIHGMTPAMNEISERYGIKTAAINAVNADMRPYLDRKFEEAATAAFKKAA
jgi:hypothetical protein